MTTQRAAEVLRDFSAWRRNNGDFMAYPHTPEIIGQAIDVVATALSSPPQQSPEEITLQYLREQTARIRAGTGYPGNISINVHAGSLDTLTVRADCWGVSETDRGSGQIGCVVESLINLVDKALKFKIELNARMAEAAKPEAAL